MSVSPAVGDGAGGSLRTATRTVARWAVTLLVGGAGMAVGLILVGQQAVDFFTAGAVGSEAERLDLGPLATRSLVHAADGSVLGVFHDEEYRIPVPLSRVPPHVVRAVLDAEDDRFYDHGPLDLRAMARAMVNNLEEGEISEGGSTITQQLVKTVLLTSKQDIDRKLQEAALAIRLEDQMTKDEILERYLNTVYFGNHSYGIQAAAERYYRVNVEQLTVGQATLLAGLIRNPVYADPYDNPQAAKERRDVIVDRMVTLDHLSSVQAEYIKAEPMPPPLPPDAGPSTGSDYFTEYVKQQLLRDVRLGNTDSERYQAVFRGGLSIHTTLNPEYQRMAEESVQSILPDTDGRFTAALVTVDPADGAVRAMVGGSDFGQTKFNLVTDTQGRQTGSSFKPFTLIAALEQGMETNDSILGSSPCVIPNPGSEDGDWKPNNVEGGAAGVLSLTEATVNSVNCAYARLIKLVGPEKVVDVAHRMGVTNELQPYLSLTLGSELVTPLQMASAYATLASDGERHAPYVVSRIDDRDGKTIFRNQSKGERAISEEHARQVNQVLTQVVQRGTGTAARVSGWDVAGKTGSTDNNTNAWFVGYTRTLSTAVWMGAPEGDVSMRNVNGVTVYGGTYPAQIWGSFTRKALAGAEPVDFAPPERGGRGGRFLALAGERMPAPEREVADDGDRRPAERAAPAASESPSAPAGPSPTTPRAAPPPPPVPAVPEPPIPDIDALIAEARQRALNPDREGRGIATGVFDSLLQVQDHDAAADRLRHRRRTLPELAALDVLETEGAALERALVDIGGRRDEVARRQRRLEDELAIVEHKLAVEQARLYGGTVSLIRELQAMQTEIDALKRRQSTLEDAVLETMTEREPLDAEVAALEARRVAMDQKAGELRAAVAEAQTAIDAELDVELQARAAAVDGIPAAVVSSYERLRTRLDGVGAARLVNGRCDGCHLSLSRTELAVALREPPDALLHCEQCGRILVR